MYITPLFGALVLFYIDVSSSKSVPHTNANSTNAVTNHTSKTENQTELTQEVMDLKKQGFRLMELRGKKVSNANISEDVFWGDIQMDSNLVKSLKKSFDDQEKFLTANGTDRMAAPDFSVVPGAKWEMPIKYTLHLVQDQERKDNIEKALKEISSAAPCIQFERAETEPKGYHIEYQEIPGRDMSGCGTSPLGMYIWYPNKNEIKLSTYCSKYQVYLHETLHSLGFGHTHQRNDRDVYLKVNLTNVAKSSKSDYLRMPVSYANDGYDYYSIMHYQSDMGALDSHIPVMEPTDPKVDIKKMGLGDGLSEQDKKTLSKIYCDKTPEAETCVDKALDCYKSENDGECDPKHQDSYSTRRRCRRTCNACNDP